ncbi:Uncharacterised protein [Chlamydia abortus]|nr:Uncharacterised protein [Chlamydia abortus]
MENSKYTAHNTDLTSQMEYLTSIIQMNPVLSSIFKQAPKLEIEHYYILILHLKRLLILGLQQLLQSG